MFLCFFWLAKILLFQIATHQNDKIIDFITTDSASKRPNLPFFEKMGVLGQPLSGFSVENYYLCAVFINITKFR